MGHETLAKPPAITEEEIIRRLNEAAAENGYTMQAMEVGMNLIILNCPAAQKIYEELIAEQEETGHPACYLPAKHHALLTHLGYRVDDTGRIVGLPDQNQTLVTWHTSGPGSSERMKEWKAHQKKMSPRASTLNEELKVTIV